MWLVSALNCVHQVPSCPRYPTCLTCATCLHVVCAFVSYVPYVPYSSACLAYFTCPACLVCLMCCTRLHALRVLVRYESSCFTCPCALHTLRGLCGLRILRAVLFTFDKNTLRFLVRSVKKNKNEKVPGNLNVFSSKNNICFLKFTLYL